MRATIVGAGVTGLTTATALAEAGWSVEILAAETFDQTVSLVAAAIWTMTSAEPAARAREWALTSRRRFVQIATEAQSGVAPLVQRELERVDPGPVWWESTPYVRRLSSDELPTGYATGFEIDGFIIEPSRYLAWLTAGLAELGVTPRIGAVGRLDDVGGDVVVNCTGLGSRQLVGDESMFPIRGQVVAVANNGIADGISDESDADRVQYVYPRSQEIILGGARQVGNDDMSPDDDLTARIIADAAILDPRTAGAPVIEVRVGLRPGRPEVRLQADHLDDGRPVIHNYGHSGAGFLLSWGCALEVVALAHASTSSTEP